MDELKARTPDPPKYPVSAKVSIEQLWHFQCHFCQQYWTIGDPDEDMRDRAKCPRCGGIQGVEIEYPPKEK